MYLCIHQYSRTMFHNFILLHIYFLLNYKYYFLLNKIYYFVFLFLYGEVLFYLEMLYRKLFYGKMLFGQIVIWRNVIWRDVTKPLKGNIFSQNNLNQFYIYYYIELFVASAFLNQNDILVKKITFGLLKYEVDYLDILGSLNQRVDRVGWV